MKTRACLIALMAGVFFLWGLAAPIFAQELGLVEMLVKNIGVTTQQAQGGAGSIFNVAKQSMGVKDFSKVTTAMPEVESLMAAAPKIEKGSGALGGFSSMLSKHTGSLGKMAGLYDSFSKLGLSKGAVGQFIPLILNYAKSNGGQTVSNLLKTALQ
ncbi:conserved hypothetical protein [Candidatus Desulfarcum epimagneticum]|uniref:DUF2780 domain-containing protein n=1 Tax=uncultured Desulfobacteraceae bacterium TaxID=218296 RepID=A0A484HJQ7_9BACT|nr:conserved hypothetical protein [uncultured Desulfobacteraceae bacterium]